MKPSHVLLAGLLATGLGACGPTQPQKTQLQIREFQTRSYDTNDTKMVMKAMLNVLQDEGFIVKNANTEIGMLTATKEMDVQNTGSAVMLSLLAGANARWDKNSIVECSANVTEFGQQTKVRATFQTKTMNNKGEVTDIHIIDDEAFYRDFFSKVDKGIFLQKEKV